MKINKYFFLDDIMDWNNRASSMERANDLFYMKQCTFSIKGSNIIKTADIHRIFIDWDEKMKSYHIYFNDYPVEKTCSIVVEIDEDNSDYIMGVPSGEIIYLKKDIIESLKMIRLVEFREFYCGKNAHVKNVNIYSDKNHNDIIYVLYRTKLEEVK